MKGTVKWFSGQKGYGFISGEDGKEYFCHFSEIEMEGFKKLDENQSVEFTPAVDEINGKEKATQVIPQQ